MDDLRTDNKIELHFIREHLKITNKSNSYEIGSWIQGVAWGQQYVMQSSDNIKRANDECRNKGRWLHQAPFGYENYTDETGLANVRINPITGPIVKKLLQEYATGNYSLNGLAHLATKLGLKLADVVVTEAGFGADLGAEKFLDIKCQRAGSKPDAVVVVATVRALKLHGGVKFDDLDQENVEAMKAGICNLKKHAENMKGYGVPVVISANRFPSDTDAEINELKSWCISNGYKFALNEGALKGSEGAVELANTVKGILDNEKSNFKPLYPIGDNNYSIKDKIEMISKQIYGAGEVVYTDLANQQINQYEEMGYRDLAVCMAKTPNSITDDAKVLGAPTGFTITVREVRLSAGAGFIVPLTGAVMTMPGLPKVPAAVKMESEK